MIKDIRNRQASSHRLSLELKAVTMASLTTNVYEANVRLKIDKISQLKSARSSQIIVQGISWQIEVYKHEAKRQNGDAALAMYLHCLNNDNTDWYCSATAILQLHSFKPNQPPLRDSIFPWVFSVHESVWCRKDFIRWIDLFDADAGYVKNDQIQIDVKICAQKLTSIEHIDLEIVKQSDPSIKLYLDVDGVQDLMAESSEEFSFGQLSWKIVVRKNEYQIDNEIKSYLGVMLYCVTKNASKWQRNIFAKFTLKSNGNRADYAKSFKEMKKYSDQSRNRGISNFISWDELINPRKNFVRNNCIAIEIEIKIQEVQRNNNKDDNNNNNAMSSPLELVCAVCLDDMIGREIMSSICGHLFCKACINKCIEVRSKCPSCNKTITKKQLHPIYLPL